jgi:pyruvate formate lyase activating enzyme
MKTAKFWHKTDKGCVQCELCPHGCCVAEGNTGICKVRGVENGELIAMGYGIVSSAHVDPIEKKPLYHFYPGKEIFSIGGWGCNLGCSFCQNWTISQQFIPESERRTPDEMVSAAANAGSIGIAYTYNEPLIGIEFVQDCAALAKAQGLVNVLVSNGYIMPAPAAELLPLIDAANVDIKSMDDNFYLKQCKGRLDPVLDFCKQAIAAGTHIEITNLIIPTLNDEMKLLETLAKWMADNLGKGVPLHLSAYHPQYKLKIPATEHGALEKAYEICRKHLLYVYVGNVWTSKGQDTQCPDCGEIIISRQGYATDVCGMNDDVCVKCGRKIEGVFVSKGVKT